MSLTAGPVRPAISGVSALPGPAQTAQRDISTLQSRRRTNLVTTCAPVSDNLLTLWWNLKSSVGQWPLQGLRLNPRRCQPHRPLGRIDQENGHVFCMDRRHFCVRRAGKEPEQIVRRSSVFQLADRVPTRHPNPGKEHRAVFARLKPSIA
jgi:hypothetical protein